MSVGSAVYMPSAPSRPCLKPGCNKLTKNRDGFCDAHADWYRKQADKRRGTAQERGYDGEWQKVRAAKKRADPLCERCKVKGIIKPMAVVHHVNRDPKDNVWHNLESLCRSCHEKEHEKEIFRRRVGGRLISGVPRR